MVFRVNARTVLELGSELISSDIIAFYELIKNAFDAGSRTGADVHFRVAMRRNEYLRIRERALGLPGEDASKATRREQLSDLIKAVASRLDPSAGSDTLSSFNTSILESEDLKDFVVRLDACYDEHNSIEISDTGSGMSLSELTTNFLTLGTPARKREVDSILAQGGLKTPLGEKGIGRLSAMRLGQRLKLETARLDDTRLSVLDIDWRLFENLDAMIEDVPIEPRRGPRKQSEKWQGTKLTIGGLLEDWTERRVREFADYDFARLTDPFLDPKSRPRIGLYWNGERIAIPWLDPALIENAHASLVGSYSVKGGEPKLELKMVAIKLGNFEHPRETDALTLTRPDLEGLLAGTDNRVPEGALASVGDLNFQIYWFNRRYLTKLDSIGNQATVRALVKKWSSIMLFRDGFRVFPYGEAEDDWLGLDAVALGRTGYVLNKNQFIGHVQISRGRNPKLVDQTNREGLRETPESHVFEEVLHDAVTERLWSFFKEVDLRYRKRTEELGDIKKEIGGLEGRAKAALGKLRKHVPREEMEVFTDLEHSLREFHDLSTRAQQRIEEVEADSRQMVQMAGVGLLVEMVAHELARSTESALASLEGLRGKDLPQEVKARLDTLRAEIKSISKRLRVLDEASVPGRQRAETFDLVRLVEDLKEGHVAQFERDRIDMRIKAPKGPLRVKLVRGMVVQILENLISNASYWMKIRADREAAYHPVIDVRIETDPLTIRFSDNGLGIAPDHRERVFRAYWSLKEKSKRRGLGLFIAASNAEDLKGKLTLSDKGDKQTGRLHEFILELPGLGGRPMSVSDVLKGTGFGSALIVDDAFDEVPIAADLEMDMEAWSIFIADIGSDVEHIEVAFPGYHGMGANGLRGSDDFVEAMYGLKEKLRPALWNTLFEAYERDRASDREFLTRLRDRLTAAGLDVKTAGRKVPDDARECKIVFADLFLGSAQQDFNVDKSIRWLRQFIAGRENAPPAVVLMSRSPLLQDKKERFRDDAKMMGALFRVYRKQDLLEGPTVETVLERLATHHADAVRVAAFLAAWEAGLSGAADEFMRVMRRLDLSDYSKIREVLLEVEGQPLGSYMLDVFDRVLQHEIEGHGPTIAAAQELNSIDPAKYPTPYIAGSSDLQDLLARSLWQHPERLKVTANTAGMPVSFGDVLIRRSRLDPAQSPEAPPDLPDALIVLTPACDLVRKPDGERILQRVLLVGGILKPIDSKTWRYNKKGVGTPIVQIPEQPRMSIDWDLDDQRMLTRYEVAALVAADGAYSLVLRLRESNALELQQRMLANMGRVGLVSKMPFTFPVEVSVFTADLAGKLKPLDLPVTAADGGVCITGRDEQRKDLTRLILTEASIDEILSVIPKIEESQVPTRARDSLKRLQNSASFRSHLQRGLDAPEATTKGSLSALTVPAEKKDGEEKSLNEVVGLIVRNPGELAALGSNEQKNGALVIVLKDLERPSMMSGDTVSVGESGGAEAAKGKPISE